VANLRILLALALLLVASQDACAEADIREVAKTVAEMLPRHHHSQADLDAAVSLRAFEGYLDALDPEHRFFLQPDVDELRAKLGSEIGFYLTFANISPVTEIHDRFLKRVQERLARIRKILGARKYSFDSTRQIPLRRSKLPWPADESAADQLWDDLLEGEVLTETLSDLMKSSQSTPAPAQRVLARYESLFRQVNGTQSKELVIEFLNCLTGAFDSHTRYMSQDELDSFEIPGLTAPRVGIGVELDHTNGSKIIQSIVPHGPAARDGRLKRYDHILAVAEGADGPWVDTWHLAVSQLEALLRGEEGTTVRLKVRSIDAEDPSVMSEVGIVRKSTEWADQRASSMLLTRKDANEKLRRLGWITLPSFYVDIEGGTVSGTRDVSQLLQELMGRGIDGLVLDLRGNRGGNMEESVRLTGLFAPAGPVFQLKDSRGHVTWRITERETPLYKGPLIVLTDKVSGGASEIVAAAFQDYRRAIIVGDKSTFGNGTVQTILPVDRFMGIAGSRDRAGGVKVTVFKYYRITGDSIQMHGVSPDVPLVSLGDVVEIGVRALRHPMPHEIIPPQPFAFWSESPLPAERLKSQSEARQRDSPELLLVAESSRRIEERRAKNSLSLNLKNRLKEIEDDRRRGAQTSRSGDSAIKPTGGYNVQEFTVEDSDIALRSNSGGKVEGDTAFSRRIEAPEVEALQILEDWIDLEAKP
jgi:carboxyl-terminal processing protease